MCLKKNEIVDLRIEDITNLGFGVAKCCGIVAFVQDTVPGDYVRCKVIKTASSYIVARVEEYLDVSCERAQRCENKLCKSCAYKNISYEYEKSIKEKSVRQDFLKAGLNEVEVMPLVASPSELFYRNKAQYPISSDGKGGYRIGFFAPKSHRVTEAADCALAPAIFKELIEELRTFFTRHSLTAYDEESGAGLLRHIYLRRGEVSGEVLLTLVINGDRIPGEDDLVKTVSEKFPTVVGILLNINKESTNVILGEKFLTLYGRDYIYDTLAGVRLKITAPSFYQVNHDAAELLYGLAAARASLVGNEILCDLYCGAGTIGLSMADKTKMLVGIEIVPEAIECAKKNAAINGIQNAHFFCGDASDTGGLLANAKKTLGDFTPDVVVIDPPRKGTTVELMDYLSNIGVNKIVYVSCGPDTLARDCAYFKSLGYEIGKVTPVDLFPGTGHVESVVCLTRK